MKKINFDKIKKKNEERKNKYKVKKLEKKEKKVNKKTDSLKKVKTRRKRFRFWYWLLNIIAVFAILLFIGGVGFCYYIVKSAPEFDKNLLFEKEASLIYDSQNNLIATLGSEQREKITFDEIPQVLVDAIIATEDSRFFQHKGFDLPRFVKAAIGQALGQNSGGASTLTMQLSKLAFTSTDSEGIKGIIRKFTDIYIAVFKMEKNYTKEEIIEYYVNTPCLGGNIYGVEQASQYYFGKSAKDLNLVEASMIAGLFQSPNGYNPYVNPNDANDRKNTVLYLMRRHGYITETEYNAAVAVEIKDLVSDGSTSVNEYQGFIDTVVQEVIDKTGNNPYDVPMIIYSTMVKSKQDVINNFYNTYKFKDKKIEVGVGVIDNDTGAIIAVGAGRNKTGAMTLNVATFSGQTKRHPGSTIKPIMDYGPAIEYENLSTYGPFIDDKVSYAGGSMHNSTGSYKGFMTMKTCLQKSVNTCALQAFNMTTNEQKLSFITSLGIYPEEGITTIPQSYSIGAFNGATPVSLAAAYSAFGSGGYYTSPYSFTKIIYRETEEEYEQDISRTRVMKAQTAYILASVLTGATTSRVKVSGTSVATKTGTTSYDRTLLKQYGLSTGVIPDSWTASFTSDYAVAIWYGYVNGLSKEAVKNKWYLTSGHAGTERLKIQAALVNKIYEKNATFKNPGGLTTASVELETIPAQKPSSYTPSSLTGKFTFISGTEPSETSTRFSELSDPTNLSYSQSGNNVSLSWTSPGIPSAIDTEYLTNFFNNDWKIEPEKYLEKRISYNTKNIGDFGFAIYLTQGTNSTYVGWTADTTYTINMSSYSGIYDGIIVKSTYSIFKSNASPGIKVVFKTYTAEDYSVIMNSLTASYTIGSTYNELNTSNVTSIVLDGKDITSSVQSLSVETTSIKNTSDSSITNLAPNQITQSAGTYNVTYTVSFKYKSNLIITKTFNQIVTVN